jgi:hypothetical protein
MTEEHRRKKEFAAALGKSRRALPYQMVIALALLAAIWACRFWLHFPVWIAGLASAVSVFGVVGDALNILHCRRALDRLGSGVEDP